MPEMRRRHAASDELTRNYTCACGSNAFGAGKSNAQPTAPKFAVRFGLYPDGTATTATTAPSSSTPPRCGQTCCWDSHHSISSSS